MEDKLGKLVEVVVRWDNEKKGKARMEKEEEREQRKMEDIRERVRVEVNEGRDCGGSH